jgi:hypothetical protein
MGSENSRVGTELCLVLATLCQGCLSAVRVACVPSGLEYRFVVCIEARWRAEVYAFLAMHTNAWIPPDAGPLNLSKREALRVCELAAQPGGEETATRALRTHYRQPRRLAVDLGGAALRDTFQP